jgi:hypothetical protein
MRFTSEDEYMAFLKTVTQRLFGRTVIDSLDLNQNAWYIDEEQVTVTAAQLNGVQSASQVQAIIAAKVQSTLAAGTGIDTDVTVTGMTATATIASVFMFAPAGPAITDVTSQYTAADGKMTKVGADATGNTLIITWVKA